MSRFVWGHRQLSAVLFAVVCSTSGFLLTIAVVRASPAPAAGRCTINGTKHHDRLVGTSHFDVICGRGGNDILRGNDGDDQLFGGAGADRLSGMTGNDAIDGGRGADHLSGRLGNDELRGTGGDDYLQGGSGDDRLSGGRGRDHLDGGVGLNECSDAGAGDTLVDCADTENPALQDFSISPASIDTTSADASVTFTADVSDDLSGVDSVAIDTTSPANPGSTGYELRTLASGTQQAGQFADTFKFPQYSTPGQHVINGVIVKDRAGNKAIYSADDLAAMGFPTSFEQTGVTDTTKPQLARLVVTPTAVNTANENREIKFTVTATDDLSGVDMVGVGMVWPTGLGSGSGSRPGSGTDLRVTWAGSLWLPRYAPHGEYPIWIELADRAGNDAFYDSNQLAAMGFTSAVEQTGSGDLREPVLNSLSIDPQVVDASSDDRTVSFRFGASDDLAGVAEIRLVVTGPNGATYSLDWPPQLVTGSDTDGVWRGDLTLPRYSPRGTYTVRELYVTDRASNERYYSPADLDAAGFPTSFENRP
jgi:hypothetical protein